jgi:hypothetical protein
MQYMFLLCATDDHRIITPEERNGRITRQYAVWMTRASAES